jgi:hypothetical protein
MRVQSVSVRRHGRREDESPRLARTVARPLAIVYRNPNCHQVSDASRLSEFGRERRLDEHVWRVYHTTC